MQVNFIIYDPCEINNILVINEIECFISIFE
jgi:hypothetical protein